MKTQRLVSHTLVTPAVAAIALASLAGAQVGGPPIPPSAADFFFGSLQVHEGPSGTSVLAVESGMGGRDAIIYSFDVNGNLTPDSTHVVDGLYDFKLGEDRLVARGASGFRWVQVHERDAAGWHFAYELSGPGLTHDIRYGEVSALEGQTLYLSDPLNSEIDIFDLATPGTPQLIDEISLPAGKFVQSMAVAGDTVIAHVGIRQLGGIAEGEVVVYSDRGVGIEYNFSLDPGPTVDLGDFSINVAATPNRFAIGVPKGTASDPCGRVFVYWRASGIVIRVDEIVGAGECSITDSLGTGFGSDVEFRSEDELLITGGGLRGARQYRLIPGADWVPDARHLSNSVGFNYAFARDWVIGLAPAGIQVFDNVNSITNEAVVCSAIIPAADIEWALFYDGSYSLADAGGAFRMNFQGGSIFGSTTDELALMLIGSERADVAFGVGANVCVGGAVRRMPITTSLAGDIVDGNFLFDPSDYGVTAGDTVFFQAWRREPGISGGGTTNALAITFIP